LLGEGVKGKEVQTRHVAHMRGKRIVQRILVGIPEGKRLHRRARRRWEGNIKMYYGEKKMGCAD
jgi:hypothetical protein